MGNCGSSPAEQPPAADQTKQLMAVAAGTASPAPVLTSASPRDQISDATTDAVPPAAVQGAQDSQHRRRRTLSTSLGSGQVTFKEEMRRTHQRLMNATSEEIAQIIDVDLDYAAAGQQHHHQHDSATSGGKHLAPDLGDSLGRRTEDRTSSSGGSRSRNSHRTKHCSADGRVEVEFTGFGRRH